jgi:methionine-rich copper-binding protein CopC
VAAGPAAAHGQLAETSPPDGSKVDDPVESVALYFTEPPALDATFEVLAPDGTKVDLGWQYGEEKRLRKPVQELFLEDGVWVPRFYDVGYAASVSVSHLPQQGKYTVSYSFTSSDDEEVQGKTAFDYTGEPTEPDGNAQRLAPPSVRPPGPAPDGVGQPTVEPAVATEAASAPTATAAAAADAGESGATVPLLIGAAVVLVLGAYGGLRLLVRNNKGAATAAATASGKQARPATGKGPAGRAPSASRNAKAGTNSRRR